MNKNKLVLALMLLALIGAFFVFDLGRFFSLEYLKSSQAEFATLYGNHPGAVICVFFAIYVAVTALSIPGAAVMTLAAGAIFGLLVGTVIVSFASSIGATLAFVAARFVLRDSVQSRFGA
ncbi:MAG TPA: pyridine nucleotide-disulfide oxidoreductase, partial [Burkholderiaceae bacterium]|nr:pyridine nucleotide-disulfide oxidoreductase [Burkholderiaceae bacterium]